MTGIVAIPHCVKFIFAKFVDRYYNKYKSFK